MLVDLLERRALFTGLTPAGSATMLASASTPSAPFAACAIGSAGDSLVVFPTHGGLDALIMAADGSVVVPEFILSTAGQNVISTLTPAVTTDSAGNAVVVYPVSPANFATDLYIARVSPTGAVLSAPMLATSDASGSQLSPQLTAGANGDVALVYENIDTSFAYAVRARVFDSTDSPVFTEVTLSDPKDASVHAQLITGPKVGYNPTLGTFLAAWNVENLDSNNHETAEFINDRSFARDGTLGADPVVANAPVSASEGDALYSSVVLPNGTGWDVYFTRQKFDAGPSYNFFGTDVTLQVVAADGTPVGAAKTVLTTDSSNSIQLDSLLDVNGDPILFCNEGSNGSSGFSSSNVHAVEFDSNFSLVSDNTLVNQSVVKDPVLVQTGTNTYRVIFSEPDGSNSLTQVFSIPLTYAPPSTSPPPTSPPPTSPPPPPPPTTGSGSVLSIASLATSLNALQYLVRLAPAEPNETVTVHVATDPANSTASPTFDYQPLDTFLTFAPGVDTQIVTVNLLPFAYVHAGNVTVKLSDPVNAEITLATATEQVPPNTAADAPISGVYSLDTAGPVTPGSVISGTFTIGDTSSTSQGTLVGTFNFGAYGSVTVQDLSAKPKKQSKRKFKVVVPTNAPTGTTTLSVSLAPAAGSTLTADDINPIVLPGTDAGFNLDIENIARNKAPLTASNASFILAGPGQATLSSANILTLSGTTSATKLTIAPTSGATVTLSAIDDTDPLGSLTVKGSLDADLSLASLGKLQIAGTFGGTSETDTRSLRATGSLGTLKLGGLAHANVFAAVTAGIAALPADASAFTDSASSIKSLTFSGKAVVFDDANIAAPLIGKLTLPSLGSSSTDTFGVAAESITMYSRGKQHFTHQSGAKTFDTEGRFVARTV